MTAIGAIFEQREEPHSLSGSF